ncbi:MAG TPA: HK97 gp10 family phage protein [Sedimenticola sp.]|nr:HK97 gp10 family phage protein [Sedimenticola sp.]
MPQVRIEGVDELVRVLGELEGYAVLRPPMQRGLSRLRERLATYPAARPRRRGFVSEQQRRWFFAALNAGAITVPYARTGTLGRSWTDEIRQESDGLVGEVGNNVVYGPYVQGHETQALYHAGNWQTDQEVADALFPSILDDFDEAIQGAMP